VAFLESGSGCPRCSTPALIGMEFLKRFRLTLLADPDSETVFLFDSDKIKEVLAKVKTTGET
jgi:hypothetical protein